MGTVDVTLVGPGGTSVKTPADQFIYSPSPPEFGRCAKAPKKTTIAGMFSDNACVQLEPQAKGKFEWLPGPGPKTEVKGKGVKNEELKFETLEQEIRRMPERREADRQRQQREDHLEHRDPLHRLHDRNGRPSATHERRARKPQA